MNFFDELDQAQALATVAVYSNHDPDLMEHFQHHKKVIGPLFQGGDFCTVELICPSPALGRLDYYVVETSSRLCLTMAYATRGEALAEARQNITDIGPDQLHALMAARRKSIAAQQANQLIQRAARPPKPRKIGKRMKAIFEESGGKCHYCQTILTLDGKWHIEHKMPRALGGDDEPTNLVAACVPCNMAKRDRTDVEFIAMRAALKGQGA